MKRSVIFLIIGLPSAAVVMGLLMAVLAFSEPDRSVREDGLPLSKTSWQKDE